MHNLTDGMLPLRKASRFVGVAPLGDHLLGYLLTIRGFPCPTHRDLLSVFRISSLKIFCTGLFAWMMSHPRYRLNGNELYVSAVGQPSNEQPAGWFLFALALDALGDRLPSSQNLLAPQMLERIRMNLGLHDISSDFRHTLSVPCFSLLTWQPPPKLRSSPCFQTKRAEGSRSLRPRIRRNALSGRRRRLTPGWSKPQTGRAWSNHRAPRPPCRSRGPERASPRARRPRPPRHRPGGRWRR